MSELPRGLPPGKAPKPRDSASAIVIRRGADGVAQVLLGVRSRRSRFMPGHLSFPGGAVDPEDRADDDGTFRRCVSRELQEEIGFCVAPDRWLEAGLRVTPPMFSVRFHNEFFVAAFEDGTGRPEPATEEIESVRFSTPRQVLDEWERGESRVPPPVVSLLRALAEMETLPVVEVARRLRAANAVEQRAPRMEFTPDVWVVPVRTATLPPATHTNVWMPGGRRFAVVDPGTTERPEREHLLEVIRRRQALGQHPAVVLLTHHHADHSAGALDLAAALSIPLRAHPQTFSALGLDTNHAGFEPLSDGEVVDLDGMTLRAIHTPGHAPDHLAFLSDRGVLLAGDLLSGMSTILIDPEHGDMTAYLSSLERVAELGASLLLPGHGPPLPGRALARLIRHRLEREDKIAGQLGASATALSELARAAYQDVSRVPAMMIERQTLSHLLRLEALGRARRNDREGASWSGSAGEARGDERG